MEDDVVLNVGDVDVKLSLIGNRLNKSGKQTRKQGRYRNSSNWSQFFSDLSRLLGFDKILGLSCTFGCFLLIWETGLALILLVLYAVSIAEMHSWNWERHCAMCVGIAVNSISLFVFFIATTFAILDLGSKLPRADVVKGLKFVVHSAILLLQVSTLIVEFTERVDSIDQNCTIFFILLECCIIFGNICMSKKEYDIASQKRLLALSGKRRKPKGRAERKHYYKRLHHYTTY